VSATLATVVTSLSPTCRCLISVGDRFPEILLIIFQTFSMGVRLFIDETKFCHDWRLLDFIVFLVWPRIILYCWILSEVSEDLTFLRAFFLFLMASLHVSLNHTVLCLRTQNLLLGILLLAMAIIFSLNSSRYLDYYILVVLWPLERKMASQLYVVSS